MWEIQKHELQADSDRSIQELTGSIVSQRMDAIMLLQEMNNFDEVNHFCMNNYQNKIWIFVKLTSKVFVRWNN